MPKKILYQFERFQIDPSRGVLLFDGQTVELSAKPFKLLLTLVENRRRSIGKEELMRRVWPGIRVSDDNLHVNLNKVRKALRESAVNPHFIFRSDDGYKFLADVKVLSIDDGEPVTNHELIGAEPNEDRQLTPEEPAEESQLLAESTFTPSSHRAHILASCALYAALYGAAVFLETAYQFNLYRRRVSWVALVAFSWILSSSFAGLMTGRKRIHQAKSDGLMITILIFLIAVAVLFAALTRLLPNEPITQAAFQTYPAQAAYLKDTVYFLVMALLFLIIPFHFVSSMEYEIEKGRARVVLDTLMLRKRAVLPRGTIYLRFEHLMLVLLMFVVLSIAMTAHLLDNLQPGTYRNLFTQLVYLRAVLYFGLGIECLVWYHSALVELKRASIARTKD